MSWMMPSDLTDIKHTPSLTSLRLPPSPSPTLLSLVAPPPSLNLHTHILTCCMIHEPCSRENKKNVKHKNTHTVHTQRTRLTFYSISWGQTCEGLPVFKHRSLTPSVHTFKLPLMKLVQLHNAPFLRRLIENRRKKTEHNRFPQSRQTFSWRWEVLLWWPTTCSQR